MIVVYVAGPYKAADSWEVSCNIHRAETLGREVQRFGAVALVPHSLSARMHGVETEAYWYEATLELLRRCDVVLFTPDWRKSVGARGEMAEASRLEKPVFYSIESLYSWMLDRERAALAASADAYTPFPAPGPDRLCTSCGALEGVPHRDWCTAGASRG